MTGLQHLFQEGNEDLLQQQPQRVVNLLSKDDSAVVTGVTETAMAGLIGVTMYKKNRLITLIPNYTAGTDLPSKDDCAVVTVVIGYVP